MKTRCPHCQNLMEVSADTNGLKMECPVCKRKFTVAPTAIITGNNTKKKVLLGVLITVLVTVLVIGIAGGAAFYIIKYKPFGAKKEKTELKKHNFNYASEEIFNLPNRVKLVMVKTPRGYYIGKYEVTQGQWKVMIGTDIYQQKAKVELPQNGNIEKSQYELRGVGDKKPMYFVNFYEALQFCKELNYKGYAPSGWKFTLPESDWYIYYGIRDYHEYSSTSIKMSCINDETSEVGRASDKNELGLYDVWGNVVEWNMNADFSINNDDLFIARKQWGCSKKCRAVAEDITCNKKARYSFFGFRLALVPEK